MNDLIIVDLPKAEGDIKGPWYNGYPVHKGRTENSLNYATLYAQQKNIIPDQRVLRQDFENFKQLLVRAGFTLHVLEFPSELNQVENLHHDAVFVRDAGLMWQDMWIKARFSVEDRSIEADVHARTISQKFNKKIIELPDDAYLEFGEVFLLQTQAGLYYFGGLSRSNKQGHDFVRAIVNPDHYILIESDGYHLDTVFCPVIDRQNKLIAFLIVEDMIEKTCLEKLRRLSVEIIPVDPIDSSGVGEELGNYAINGLVAPGMLLNACVFETPGVEEKLLDLGIQRYVSPLTYFRYAGGSYHCLTNEIYS